MADVARHDCQAAAYCRRSNGKVGEAGRVTIRPRSVHQFASRERRRDVERNHPVAIEMKNEVQPFSKERGSGGSSGPFQLDDAITDFRHGDRGQE